MTAGADRDEQAEVGTEKLVQKLFIVLLLLFVFLCGIRGMGEGFKGLGKDLLETFFHATDNPFVGLVVGILGTTLVQSSSVTTSMIVALVAAPGNPLPISNAIPMIMGANIGTTVTNTVVSLGHAGHSEEFRRAFSTATCHDFFNFLAVAILLPLELATGLFAHVSDWMASLIGAGSTGAGKLPNPVKEATKIALAPVERAVDALAPSEMVAAIILIVISAGLIFVALLFIVKNLRALAASRLKVMVQKSLGANAYVGILIGALVTVMVQSSSITTSVLVPLAAAGLLTLEQAFPITLGANIGTTVTAIIASAAAPSETAHLAVQIAVVHLLFNVAGIVLIYPIPAIRRIPLRLAQWLADVAVENKRHALMYVAGIYYALPAALVLVTRAF